MRMQEGREVPQALLEAPQSRGQSRRVKVHLQIDCQLLRGPARFIQDTGFVLLRFGVAMAM